jgi:hypothetical protein
MASRAVAVVSSLWSLVLGLLVRRRDEMAI